MSLWWPGEWDRLISKFEDWIVKRNGYSKLQPMILSRGYQTLVNKQKLHDRSCTTFRFTDTENHRDSKIDFSKPGDARGSYTHKPTSIEVTKDISQVPELCLSSLDKMEAVLKQYERAFSKLQKRGPKRSNTVISHNFDLLNEDVIQNIFLKCYHGNRNCHEIATSKIMNPDTTPVKLDKFSIAENYNGLLDLEKHGHCMVEKLQFFENQLQETRIKIQALTFSKMELEKILEKERKELESTKSQLKVFQDAMQYWEREHLNERNSLVVQSLQLEILQKEKITLNDEIKDLEKKNIKLTMQVEEIQTQLRNQNDLANSMNSNRKTFEKTVEKVYSESQKLEKDFNFLKKQVALSKHVGEQMIVLLKHHHEALNKVYEENESLKQSLFTQAGELQWERKTPKNHDMNLDRIEVEILQKKLKESEKNLADLNRELDTEKKEKRKLSETLNIALSDQIKFNEMEQYLRTCISNLENQLEKKFQSESDTKIKIN